MPRERAREQAKASEERHRRGGALSPLDGVPFAAKDIFATQGIRTAHGSKLGEHNVPGETATTVERLEAAGAVLLGKLNLLEYATGSGTSELVEPMEPGIRERFETALDELELSPAAGSISPAITSKRSGCAFSSRTSSRGSNTAPSTLPTSPARRHFLFPAVSPPTAFPSGSRSTAGLLMRPRFWRLRTDTNKRVTGTDADPLSSAAEETRTPLGEPGGLCDRLGPG